MEANITQTSITTTTLIISILSSSIITAIFTKWTEFYFGKLNYKRDYFKIILEKRLASYESLLNLLFRSGNGIKDHDGKTYARDFDTAAKILNYRTDLLAIQNNRMWISSKVDPYYAEFLVHLNDEINRFDINQSSVDEYCISFAKEIHQRQIFLGRQLHLSIVKDLKDLYKIDQFFEGEITDSKNHL